MRMIVNAIGILFAVLLISIILFGMIALAADSIILLCTGTVEHRRGFNVLYTANNVTRQVILNIKDRSIYLDGLWKILGVSEQRLEIGYDSDNQQVTGHLDRITGELHVIIGWDFKPTYNDLNEYDMKCAPAKPLF